MVTIGEEVDDVGDGGFRGGQAGGVPGAAGPSGSGKGAPLRMIAGIERVDVGRVLLGDRMVIDERSSLPPERFGFRMVFEDHAFSRS